MGLKNMRIVVDNPHAAYYVGQTVSGKVIVAVDSPKKIRSITIKFKGEAEVLWKESESQTNSDGKSQDVDVSYTSSETYFENKYFLVGGANGEIELPQGEHTYPFSCPLPPTLPSSFEGEYGHIRYTVKATLDRPWKFDQECKMAFTVVAPVDLNVMPEVKEPVELEEGKSFCCLFCASGPLQLTVSIPASGFVPGQTIPFSVKINNNSNVEVQCVKCVLRKEVKWHSTLPTRKEKISKTPISELMVSEKITAQSSKAFTQDIRIPPLPPSNLKNCSIIDLSYVFKVELVVGGFHGNLNAYLPIVLGTIPLLSGPTAFVPGSGLIAPVVPTPIPTPAEPVGPMTDDSVKLAPAPSPTPMPGGGWNVPALTPVPLPGGNVQPGGYAPPIGMATPVPGLGVPDPHAPSAPPLYPSLPPPSYEETVFGGNSIKDSADNDHTMGITNFAPKYPVWNFNPNNAQTQ